MTYRPYLLLKLGAGSFFLMFFSSVQQLASEGHDKVYHREGFFLFRLSLL